jgi:hypothetical protein
VRETLIESRSKTWSKFCTPIEICPHFLFAFSLEKPGEKKERQRRSRKKKKKKKFALDGTWESILALLRT